MRVRQVLWQVRLRRSHQAGRKMWLRQMLGQVWKLQVKPIGLWSCVLNVCFHFDVRTEIWENLPAHESQHLVHGFSKTTTCMEGRLCFLSRETRNSLFSINTEPFCK